MITTQEDKLNIIESIKQRNKDIQESKQEQQATQETKRFMLNLNITLI